MIQLQPGNPRMDYDRQQRLQELEMQKYIADLTATLDRERLALEKDRLGEDTRRFDEGNRLDSMRALEDMAARNMATLSSADMSRIEQARARNNRANELRGYQDAVYNATPGTALEALTASEAARAKALGASLGVSGGQTQQVQAARGFTESQPKAVPAPSPRQSGMNQRQMSEAAQADQRVQALRALLGGA